MPPKSKGAMLQQNPSMPCGAKVYQKPIKPQPCTRNPLKINIVRPVVLYIITFVQSHHRLLAWVKSQRLAVQHPVVPFSVFRSP